MSTNKSQAQATIVVDESETIVVDMEVAQDEVYRTSVSERRRHVLTAVRRESTPIDAGDLARQVTIQEACDNSRMVTEESIREVHVSLHHHHLPKLADLGVIEYDPEAKIVEEITGMFR